MAKVTYHSGHWSLHLNGRSLGKCLFQLENHVILDMVKLQQSTPIFSLMDKEMGLFVSQFCVQSSPEMYPLPPWLLIEYLTGLAYLATLSFEELATVWAFHHYVKNIWANKVIKRKGSCFWRFQSVTSSSPCFWTRGEAAHRDESKHYAHFGAWKWMRTPGSHFSLC